MYVLGVAGGRDSCLLQLNLITSCFAGFESIGKYSGLGQHKVATSEACERGSGHAQTCQRGLYTPCIFFLRFLSTHPSCTGAAGFGFGEATSGSENAWGSVSGMLSKTMCR